MSKTIEVAQIEFNEGGNTLWIHTKNGSTALRIKCTGKITSEACQNSPFSHGDIFVEGDIHLCLGKADSNKEVEWPEEPWQKTEGGFDGHASVYGSYTDK